MNPYVYSKRGKSKAAPAVAEAPTMANLARHLLNAPIGTALAFAVVVFAAGSVMAMTVPAYEEIAMGDMSFSPVQVAKASVGKVLGETTTVAIDDTALEAVETSGEISVKAVAYDPSSGRWNYIIKYSVSNAGSGATLSIGNYVIKSGITEAGYVETGSILKPGREYRVMLWMNDGTGRQVLARAGIKTKKSDNTVKDNKIMTLCKLMDEKTTNSNSGSLKSENGKPVMCVLTKEGKTICPERAQCEQVMPKVTPSPTQ